MRKFVYAVKESKDMTSYYEVNSKGQVKYLYWTDQKTKERHNIVTSDEIHGQIKMVSLSMGGNTCELLTWDEFVKKANSFSDSCFLKWITHSNGRPRVKVYEKMVVSTVELNADFRYSLC